MIDGKHDASSKTTRTSFLAPHQPATLSTQQQETTICSLYQQAHPCSRLILILTRFSRLCLAVETFCFTHIPAHLPCLSRNKQKPRAKKRENGHHDGYHGYEDHELLLLWSTSSIRRSRIFSNDSPEPFYFFFVLPATKNWQQAHTKFLVLFLLRGWFGWHSIGIYHCPRILLQLLK